ncbi:MAG: bacillithiol biosynthesis cysteine-adding enzyme BshC [Hyphomicrobiales bacterium]
MTGSIASGERRAPAPELERLLLPSALFRDFLNDPASVRAFYPADFRDPAAVAARAGERAYPAERRARVAAVLRRQAERFGVLDASRESLARFERPNAIAVVSGQQPGLFGGPLYSLYKILTAISIARSIEAATSVPAVPIFWIASDDHDFDEVRRAHLGDGSPQPTAVEYPLDKAPHGVSVARITFGPAIEATVRAAESLLPPSEFREPLLARLREAYAPGRGWAEAYARFVGAMVAEQGALVFDAADEESKAIAMPVFEREIALRGRSAEAARERGEALARAGYHAQIARAGNELNLFWHGREREAVRVAEGGGFRLATSNQDVTESKLLALVRGRPADVSPGVLLRPLVQDHLFPTAAYVGGPAEVAYWAQVNALYPLFDMEPPAIAPRAGATLLEPKVARTLDRFGIEWSSLAGDPEPAITAALRALLPEDFPTLFTRERGSVLEAIRRIDAAVLGFDPSLRSAVETTGNKVKHETEVLEKKLMQVWKRRQEETVAQMHRAAGALFPHGHLQERTLSPLGFLARFGPALPARVGEALGAPGSHTLIPLGGTPS